jgi:hypothetical protein
MNVEALIKLKEDMALHIFNNSSNAFRDLKILNNIFHIIILIIKNVESQICQIARETQTANKNKICYGSRSFYLVVIGFSFPYRRCRG